MKTVPVLVQSIIDAGSPSLAFGIRITRKDGTVLAWTDHDRAKTVTVDGDPLRYAANPGFQVQSIVSTSGLAPDNTEFRVLAGDDITRPDILARKWDGASTYIKRYDWKQPAAGVIPVKRGWLGNMRPKLGEFVVEFRDLRQALQHNSTWVLQEACRWRFADARCALSLSDFTFAGTVTAVASAYTFTDSALAQAADYFGEGEVTWLTGLNAGTPAFKVRTHATGGVITLSEAAIYDIGVGDAFTIVAGCRKRFSEDCKTKFDNAVNYGGEKDKPKRDDLMAPAQHTDLG